MDLLQASQLVDERITAEVAHQNNRFGPLEQRADVREGQLFLASFAQSEALFERRDIEGRALEIGLDVPFDFVPSVYPEGWTGFRDYGSDFANLAVIAAFVQQEMIRLAMNGEDTTRLHARPQPISQS